MTELKATRTSSWKNDYELLLDGRKLADWNAKTWRAGGSFDLDGRTYEVKSNTWATRYELLDHLTGATIAVAERPGRKSWSIEAEGRTYAFERPSIWRLEEHLIIDGRPAGKISRASLHDDNAEADLPGLPPHLQVFALLVVLSGWDLAADTAT